MPEDQEGILWDVAEKLHAAYATNALSSAQFFQLALAWKGVDGFLGWGGVAPSLAPTLRGPLAYVMGRRHLRSNPQADARPFFRTALQDAPADSALHRLAQLELDRLKAP